MNRLLGQPLPARLSRLLVAEGITDIDDLLGYTASELLRVPGVGRGFHDLIADLLAGHGLVLQGSRLHDSPIRRANSRAALYQAKAAYLEKENRWLTKRVSELKKLIRNIKIEQSNVA